MTLPEFLSESLEEAYTPFLGAPIRPFHPGELQAYLGRTVAGEKEKKDKYELPYIHKGNIPIVDEAGHSYDLGELKRNITTRPSTLLKQNDKMVHSDGSQALYFNIGLPALKGLAVNEKTGEFVIVDTCPGAGACKVYCYAMKGGYIQWKHTSLGSTRVLNFLLNDPDGFERQLTQEIHEMMAKAQKKGLKIVIRWHDAGDFFSPQYMDLAFDVARKFPTIDFYAYTKLAGVAQSHKPDNFIISFSQGGQPSQEKLIDITRSKHSKVVPKEIFNDLLLKQGRFLVKGAHDSWQFKDEESIHELKRRVAHKYGLSLDTIITYPEMMKIPLGQQPHWNVLVWHGHGDEAANRRDVIGTYLLVH